MRAAKIAALVSLAASVLCLGYAAYIPLKGAAAEMLIERAWSQSQAQGAAVLPWPWMDAKPLVRLSVPRLGAGEIVLDTGTGQALGFAPSHLQQTPPPGALGLSVIAAHKNTHFAFLQDIIAGDIIEIEHIDRGVTRFKVTQLTIVDKDTSGIDMSAAKAAPQIALVTCYPFSTLSYGGPLRYIVYGVAIEEPQEARRA